MRRPNILILYTDQQRWDALGAAGNPEIQTPNLDRLAAQGTMFTHHFVQNPVCMPSRLSFLTGQYPGTLGITHMGVTVPPETVTLPKLLRGYGYRTANIGKLHFLPHANRDHRTPHPDYGFDHLEISDEPGPYEDAYRAWVRHHASDQLDHISVGLPPSAEVWQKTMRPVDSVVHPAERFPKGALPFRGRSDLTHTAFVSEQTRAFIGHHAHQPWLCIAGFYSPHSPWVVPQEYLDRYDPADLTLPDPAIRDTNHPFSGSRGAEISSGEEAEVRSAIHGYYAMVSEVDDHVGRILDHLDELGIADETMVIFTSDHGELLGKYGRYGKGYPADDTISRVPLLIRWPGGTAAPPRVTDIVEAVDVLPTILDVAGIQRPATLQGHSLAQHAAIGDAPSTARPPRAALTEHHGWKTLRTGGHRYIAHADGRELLFDLTKDPNEMHDVAADDDYNDTLAEHRHLLIQKLLDRERPLERTWTY